MTTKSRAKNGLMATFFAVYNGGILLSLRKNSFC